jgi:methylglutaconyl-CoA hydratase
MSQAAVLTSVDSRGVATITLNRPTVNNAYDGHLLQGLADAAAATARNPGVRLVVIRGNGRHFQAGADLAWLTDIAAQDAAANLAASRLTAETLRALNALAVPTVALVQGACIGGGTGLVASCDVVIAEDSAVFAISEARWGLVASIIFPQLIAAIGLRQVRRYALSCERFDAARAQVLGLVHEICAPGTLDQAAATVIEGVLSAGPDAVAASKRSALAAAGTLGEDDLFERLIAEHAAKRQSAEAVEGLRSFTDKRAAAWYPSPQS